MKAARTYRYKFRNLTPVQSTMRQLFVDINHGKKRHNIHHESAWLEDHKGFGDGLNPVRTPSFLMLSRILVENQQRAFAGVVNILRWSLWQDDTQVKCVSGGVLERLLNNTLTGNSVEVKLRTK